MEFQLSLQSVGNALEEEYLLTASIVVLTIKDVVYLLARYFRQIFSLFLIWKAFRKL